MKILKWLFVIALAAITVSVFLQAFARPHKDPPSQDEDQEEAVQASSRVSVINGQTFVTLDEATQKSLGIAVARLRAVNTRRVENAAATVLSAQGLVTLRSAYVSALAQLKTAQAQLAVSSQEYDRLKTLYAENQNTSKKALQSAQGMERTNRATLDAAQASVGNAQSAVRQSWGGVVASWISGNSSLLASVLDQQVMLVQVTLPPGTPFEHPPKINLSIPTGNVVNASYVSPFPRVDARIQGVSMLYLTRAYPALQPGMNLVAHLPAGRRLRGILIPRAAIVWWQGRPCVYEQVSPTRFARRTVPGDLFLGNEYFAAGGFVDGVRVVTQGAQVLLSEEFRAQIQPQD